MGAEGFEQPEKTSKKTGVRESGGNKSGNINGENGAGGGSPRTPETPNDPQLAAVIEAWHELPAAVRTGIVAMVSAAGGER